MNPLFSLTDSSLKATEDYTFKEYNKEKGYEAMYKYVFTFVFIRCKIESILFEA